MNLLERVLTLLQANLNTVVEKADDPEKTLRQLQLDMRNQLVQVKTQVATAIAEGYKLQKRSKERSAEADVWLKKAEQAIRQQNDDLARTALTHYNSLLRQTERYQQQQKDQEQLVSTMRNALRQLEAKLSEVDTTIDLLVTRKRNALLQQRVYETLSKGASPKERERTAKAQDAVQQAEARARALAELHLRDTDIDVQLDALSTTTDVEQQLEYLKNRQPSSSVPLLKEGEGQVSPLLHPRPQAQSPTSQPLTQSSSTQRTEQTKQKTIPASPAQQREEITLERLRKLLGDTPQ